MANIKIYIPTFVSDQNFTPARVNPRAFFYNGTLDCEPFLIESNDGGVISQTEIPAFPYFDHYSLEPGGTQPGPSSNSLLFLNENAVYGTPPTSSLYDGYWEKYVSLLYDPATRLLDASAIISLADYNEMELNDIVQFRGNYFHLRAINEYDVKTGVCKIQLLGPILGDAVDRTVIPINCEFDFTAVEYIPPTTTTTTTLTPTTTTTTTTTVYCSNPTGLVLLCTDSNGCNAGVVLNSCVSGSVIGVPATPYNESRTVTECVDGDNVFASGNNGFVVTGYASCSSTTTTTSTSTTTTSTTLAPTTTTTTTTTAAPITYTYYTATECGNVDTANIRSSVPLNVGQAVELFGTCYEITTVGGTFGFDYTNVYLDCTDCQNDTPINYYVVEGGETSGGTLTYTDVTGSGVTQSLSSGEYTDIFAAVSQSVNITGVGSQIFRAGLTNYGQVYATSSLGVNYQIDYNTGGDSNDRVVFYVPINGNTITFDWLENTSTPTTTYVCTPYTSSFEVQDKTDNMTITISGSC